jgi:polysaccharide biosynthesis protein PslH
MRILIASPWVPYPPRSGMTIRIIEIARRLAREHEVTFALATRWPIDLDHCDALSKEGFGVVALPGNRGARTYLESLRALLKGHPPDNAFYGSRTLEKHLMREAGSFDVIQLEYEIFGRLPYLIPGGSRAISAIVLHDLLSESYSRIAKIERSRRAQLWRLMNVPGFRRFECNVLPRYDLSIVMSERERAIVACHVDRSRIVVVPNCADLSSPMLEEVSNASPVILFVGQLEYPPNIDAARWLVDDIFPRIRAEYPSAQLLIVGRPEHAALRLYGEGIVDAGVVADLTPYYRSADLVIAPLRAGGGTRLKILEAMAKGRVVVSTSLGAEGLHAIDGHHLVLADSGQALAEAVVALFRERARRTTIRSQARTLVEARYSWDDAAQILLDRYLELYQRRIRAPDDSTPHSASA